MFCFQIKLNKEKLMFVIKKIQNKIKRFINHLFNIKLKEFL